MSKIKSIPAKDVEKLIGTLEKGLKLSKDTFNKDHYGASAMAYGSLTATTEHVIKQLKGEYRII